MVMLTLPNSSVFPSFACAAALVPTIPPAPPRFSTTTGWPSCAENRSASRRASRSAGPPAAKGTMIRTGRVGQAWAKAGATGRTSASASSARRRRPV
jgi:hypothetical protein